MINIEKNPLYSVWKSMKSRCNNTNNSAYHRYGERGITVCERWQNNFHIFVSDMGERPSGYTLERIDNNLGYSPENCKWATRKEQQLNRHNTVFVIIEGIKYKAAEIAKITGLKTDSIIDRASNNLTLNQILNPEKRVFKEGLALGGNANGAKQRAKTHCKNGHEFTISNTLVTKEGWRSCRRCHADRQLGRR